MGDRSDGPAGPILQLHLLVLSLGRIVDVEDFQRTLLVTKSSCVIYCFNHSALQDELRIIASPEGAKLSKGSFEWEVIEIKCYCLINLAEL